jgi:hypothetical protein
LNETSRLLVGLAWMRTAEIGVLHNREFERRVHVRHDPDMESF